MTPARTRRISPVFEGWLTRRPVAEATRYSAGRPAVFNESRCTALLSPFNIKDLALKNRVVKSPQASGNATPDGEPTQGAFDYYESLAEGGVGLVIVEGAAIDYPLGVVGWPRFGIHTDALIPAYARLTDLVHQCGAKAFLEIQHAGPSHPMAMAGLRPVGPSALDDKSKPVKNFDTPRELSLADIERVQWQYVMAAERAEKAGFDGIDLHGAHRYLINAFLSRAWNRRRDAYGGDDLESRARFAVEIIRAIKQRVSRSFIVGIRYNVAEWGLKDGITVEEGQRIGKLFEAAGADFLDISGYGYGNFLWGYWGDQLGAIEAAPEVRPWLKTVRRPGFIVSQAAKVKKGVSLPAARRQLKGFGSIISFDVRGGAQAADAVCAGLHLIQHATSLGAVESTIERRATIPGHEHLPPALLRLSVGIEAVEDLWTDLDRALRNSTGRRTRSVLG